MDKLRSVLRGNASEDLEDTEESRGLLDEFNESLTLSWSSRIQGFLILFIVGIVFSFLGSFFLMIPGRGLTLFVVFYSLGNIMSIGSTCFLMGPVNQMKRMFAETRFVATIVMLLCIALTLMSALWWHKTLLCILFCALQFLALTWYSLSYIPYARNMVRSCLNSCLA